MAKSFIKERTRKQVKQKSVMKGKREERNQKEAKKRKNGREEKRRY